MNWNFLTDIHQLDTIDEISKTKKVLILKHSTRCAISGTALNRIERNWEKENAALLEIYYLDLLSYRNISNAIAERYHIQHESPQALIISNGSCVFSQTHMQISLEEILEAASA